MNVHIVYILLILQTVYCTKWIDPHDMNTNHKEKLKSMDMDRNDFCKTCACSAQQSEDTQCLFYLKRFISLLISQTSFDQSESLDFSTFSGHIYLRLKLDDHKYLKDFMETKNVGLDSLRRLDEILSEGIQRDILNEYLEVFERFETNLYYSIFNIKTLILFGIVLILYVVYDLFKHNFSFLYILKYLLFVILIADYGVRYKERLEEADNHNMKVHVSSHCDPAKMSWGQYFSFMWTARKNECDIKTVTPLDVLLYQVRSLIIVPMQSFGTAFGGFGKELFTSLPFPLNIVIGPLMLLLACFLLMGILSLMFGTSIKFNLLHMFNLEFGRHSEQTREERISGSTLTQILDAINLHRIEDVKQNKPSISRKEKKYTDKKVKNKTPPLEQGRARRNTSKERSIDYFPIKEHKFTDNEVKNKTLPLKESSTRRNSSNERSIENIPIKEHNLDEPRMPDMGPSGDHIVTKKNE